MIQRKVKWYRWVILLRDTHDMLLRLVWPKWKSPHLGKRKGLGINPSVYTLMDEPEKQLPDDAITSKTNAVKLTEQRWIFLWLQPNGQLFIFLTGRKRENIVVFICAETEKVWKSCGQFVVCQNSFAKRRIYCLTEMLLQVRSAPICPIFVQHINPKENCSVNKEWHCWNSWNWFVKAKENRKLEKC